MEHPVWAPFAGRIGQVAAVRARGVGGRSAGGDRSGRDRRARLGFAAVRLAGALASARPGALPPSGRRAAVHLTAVARLPCELAVPLAGEAAVLADDDPLHLRYPADALHVTILSLDELLAPPERVAPSQRGMRPSRSTSTASCSAPHRCLHAPYLATARSRSSGASSPGCWRRRPRTRRAAPSCGGWRTSRCCAWLRPSGRLRREVARRRRRLYGTLTVERFDVMRSDLLLSSASLPLLSSPLAGRPPAR